MSNVIPIRYSKTQEIKHKNDDIIYGLYREGKVKHDPRARNDKYSKGDIIEVPAACFVAKKAYKVGA